MSTFQMSLFSWKATKEYLNQRGTKIRVFRVCFRTPFLPPFFPHFSPLFPLQALCILAPLLPSSPPPSSPPFLAPGKVRFRYLGHTPSTAGTFRKKFRKNSGKTPETLSERFLEFPSRVRLGCPKRYNSRHLRLPERFQNSLPPSTAGDASFFRIGSGDGLSELVMEFPAVLGVFLSTPLT